MKRLHILAAALVAAAPAFAQNLNPTIVVTNTYEGSAADIRKPDQVMQVPDSVMKFNLDFDYSVFSTPYRGAYEFHPYLVSMKPRPAVSDESTLFIEAGAGYTLRPQGRFVWKPQVGDNFSVSLHGDLDSYFGDYRFCRLGMRSDEGQRRLDWTGACGMGSDIRGGLGIDAGYAWRGGEAGFGVSWLNQSNRDPLAGEASPMLSYNRLDLEGFARSTQGDAARFTWSGRAGLRFAGDELAAFSPHEQGMGLEAGFGTVLGSGLRLRADAGLEMNMVGTDSRAMGGVAWVAPHLLFAEGLFSVDLGIRADARLRDDALHGTRTAFYESKGQIIYPDVHIRCNILEDQLTLYSDMTGGSRLNTYSSLVDGNHFFRWNYLDQNRIPLDFSTERYRIAFGVRGQVAERFHFDLDGGNARWHNGFLDAVPYNDDSAPCMGYADFDLLFADLSLGWLSGDVSVDSRFSLKHCTMEQTRVFAPSLFSGDIRAMYDWKGRIKGGVTAEFATARKARYDDVTEAALPGYVDLGLEAVLRFNARIALWLRAGNLLNQTIQRHPLYAEDGIFLTGGIRWNIR